MNALHRKEEECVEEILQNLRTKGIRITDTRRAVLAYLVASHEHPSAEKIYRDLLPQFPGMSLATVYNNIKVLIDEGVVSEIKVRNDTTTYFDFMGHEHLNVVCEKCGRIADVEIDVPDLREEAASKSGYRITKTQMTVYGICPDCQKH